MTGSCTKTPPYQVLIHTKKYQFLYLLKKLLWIFLPFDICLKIQFERFDPNGFSVQPFVSN